MPDDLVQQTLFDLPVQPDSFAVSLAPPDLRRLDFSGLDYTTARRAILETIATYFPNDFNDFVASNGIIMIMEVVASVVAKLSLRADLLSNESFLPTCQTEEAVVNHLALINQKIQRQTPAVVDMEVSVSQPAFTDIEIDPGIKVSTTGTDGKPIVYEVFRAPGDFTSKITIPAGKRGVIAYGIEGQFAGPVILTSPGGPNQQFTINDPNALDAPIIVTTTVGNTDVNWTVIPEPIERFGPNDFVVESNFLADNLILRFGDNVTGAAPQSGQKITIKYRTGGGIRGRVGVGQLDTTMAVTPLPPANASMSVRFRNVTASSGGTDKETLDQAKKRAPKDFAVHKSIVTADDYAQIASSFTHPVFGAVSKAVATIRTGYNANLVEIYALATGADGLPVTPSAGLKLGLKTFFEQLNVLTDHVNILDGVLHPVDIEMTVVVHRNADATVVKEQVGFAIDDFFSLSNWELGQPFYVSNFIQTIKAIDGVLYVDIFTPVDNILQTGLLASAPSPDGIGINELIVGGKRSVNIFYEKVRRQ